MPNSPRPLTATDKAAVFKIATAGLRKRYSTELRVGMTDRELHEALIVVLGIFGSTGGPDQLDVSFQGAGLKIWGGWQVVNTVTDIPLFAGTRTIAMAREVYAIPNPDTEQLQLI